jgi:hypothetical protein
MTYVIKGQKKLVTTERDFEEVVACVENDTYAEPVTEVWRGRTKIFDSRQGWCKDKLTEEEKNYISKIRTFYGVDIGITCKDMKKRPFLEDDIYNVLDMYKSDYGSRGVGFGYYDWQREYASRKYAEEVYKELVKLFKRYKIKFETNKSDDISYIYRYKIRRVG